MSKVAVPGQSRPLPFVRAMLLAVGAYVVMLAWLEFYNVAWGTGIWLGELSANWAALLLGFTLLALAALGGLAAALWRPSVYERSATALALWRARLGAWRWPLVLLIAGAPVWFLQYTQWGIVFRGPFLRLLLWMVVALCLASLIERGRQLLTLSSWLGALVLSGVASSIGEAFANVTSYPFSLGWSEGNRLWDYSVLFGRRHYDYPAGNRIVVLLDYGRQLVGGLPFLIPGVSIGLVRFWLGLTVTLPYVFLGLAAFRAAHWRRGGWLLAGLWTMLFLKQGPIHPPLVFIAAFTALLWGRSLWLAVPLVAALGFLAEESRFTWLFAPGIWLGMLELAGARLASGRIQKADWIRSLALGAAGAFGGYFGPRIVALLTGTGRGGVSLAPAAVARVVDDQPLLWYRLLPNATYGTGILAGLAAAVGPLLIVLVYLAVSRRWVLNVWQKLAVIGSLAAFLVVGLVVSTKIGGGGDLHNMDMFLIGMLFAAAVAARAGGARWLRDPVASPAWAKAALVLVFLLPPLQPLRSLRTIRPVEDLTSLRRLTDSEPTRTFDLLLPRERVERILAAIQAEVDLSQLSGEVLFMDQRQLLTFGAIRGVALVPEYEKKLLMNDALTGNPRLFRSFYTDLAAQRFSLIVSEPMRAPVKDSSFQFGEENNAWAYWVANPVLCFYEAKQTFRDVQIQLLVPRADISTCTLPTGPPSG